MYAPLPIHKTSAQALKASKRQENIQSQVDWPKPSFPLQPAVIHHPKVEPTRKGNNKKTLQKLNHERYTCSRVPATNQRQHGVGGGAKFSQSASTLLTTHQPPRTLLWEAVGGTAACWLVFDSDTIPLVLTGERKLITFKGNKI